MKYAALLTAVLMVTNHAQEPDEPSSKPGIEITTKSQTISEESVDWGHEKNEGGSRIGMSGTKRPGKTKIIRSTTEIRQVIDVKQQEGPLECESDIDLEYYQRDTQADIRTRFSSDNCQKFDATYQLQIAYFNSEGKFKRIVADEEWPDDLSGPYRKSYQMEPDSELKRVTSRILSCTCKE